MAFWSEAQQQEAKLAAVALGVEFADFRHGHTDFRPVTYFNVINPSNVKQFNVDKLIKRLDDKFTEENDAAKR